MTRFWRGFLPAMVIFIHLTFGALGRDRDSLQQWRQELWRIEWLDRTGARDSCLQLIYELLARAKKSGDPASIADVELCRIRHFAHYESEDSLRQYLDPLIQFSNQHNLEAAHVEALVVKTEYYLNLERYREAMQTCEEAAQLARPLNNQRLDGLCMMWKGCVSRVTQDNSNAPLPYFYDALRQLQITKDTFNVIRIALLIAGGEQDEIKQTELFNLAETLIGFFPCEILRLRVLNFKAAEEPGEKAIPTLREAIRISKNLKTPAMTQHLLIQLSYRYLWLRQYDEAIAAVDSARIEYSGKPMANGYFNYYEIYKEKGDYASAVMYVDSFRQYEDERRNEDLKSLMAEWETRLNTREKEWEIKQNEKELENQKTRNWLLFIILLLSFVVGGIAGIAFFRQRKARHLLTRQHDTIKRQAEELQSLERIKSRFFANVSHELRTPLTLILGPLSSLLKQGTLEGKSLKLLELARQNGNLLLKLVNEILDLSKLEAGRIEVKETPVNFIDFLRPLVAQFNSFGEQERIAIGIDYQADPALSILLDTGKFEKIIHNFLSNALKFTPHGGQITLIVKEEADHLTISVKDTGPGIHPDDLPRIFDRFYQSKLPDTPVQGGTGIGLSLCSELAQLLNGEVWAASTWGEGSEFFFRFPKKMSAEVIATPGVFPEHAEEAGMVVIPVKGTVTSEKTDLQEVSSQKPHILIVEDNLSLQQYMCLLLETDYEVTTAENGLIGWEKLQTGPQPQLIISDLMMPVLDGFQLLEKIKDNDALRHIPVIMLTARADVKVKLRALRIGVDDYMTKPFLEEELMARMVNLLRNHAERKKTYLQEEGLVQQESLPARPIISKVDAEWLETVENLFSKYLSDHILQQDFISSQLHIGERQFRRRIKQLTGLSPQQYLQEMRLQRAREFLWEGHYSSVKEVCVAVGFSDTKYFSDLFFRRFGIRPSTLQH